MGLALIIFSSVSGWAGDPTSAVYCQENDRIFWFVTITDTHIGTSGSQDTDNLSWVVHEGKNVINPSFIILAGDITDSTDGNLLGYPNGPYQSEWDQYRATLDMANTGINADNFFDIPGNHDAYSDADFSYYLNNSVQGLATGRTQVSWTRQFSYGTYHFLGINTSANDGSAFSLFFPYGDYAGLDTTELSYIGSELALHSDAELTFIFGHHPMKATGNSEDTWIFYGASELASLMESYGVSSYLYGHTHRFSESFFTGDVEYETATPYQISPGVFYTNIDSLGKSSDNHFNITAVDCNGISMVTRAIGIWPAVIITAPMDRNLGRPANPLLQYTVPNGPGNPLRALLFDPDTSVCTAEYRIDGSPTWHPMDRVPTNPNLWEASWDSSGLSEGDHTIEVRATGSEGTIRTDSVTVYVEGESTVSYVDQFVSGEIPVSGKVSNSFSDTAALDGIYETITERVSGGKPSKRYSYLEHIWTIPVEAGTTMTLFAQLQPSASTDGDAFAFAYSTDNVHYTPMFTTSGADLMQYSANLPASINGTLYVRVTDTDRTAGNKALDSIAVDQLYVRTSFEAGEIPDSPSGLTATAVSSTQINLSWNDNSDNEFGFRIERLDASGWIETGIVGADVQTYADTGLQPSTAYTYRVSAYNNNGDSAYSNESTATTEAGAAIALDVQTSKVRGNYIANIAWSGATSNNVDIYKNGALLTTVANKISGSNSYSDPLGKKPSGSYTYQVCEASSNNCSETVTVSF